MIRDVTKTWAEESIREGLYIVRCTNGNWTDRVRVGAGAINDGAHGLRLRLTEHGKPWRKSPDCETHKLQPFAELVKAWALDGWSGDQIRDGEKCLWRAFAVRYPKHRGTLADKSIFVVPIEAILDDLFAEVETDLSRLESVHANPAALVDVPHVVTARKGTPRIPRIHHIQNERK